MKILQCMANIDPEKGGPSSAIRGLSRSLTKQGHSVTVLAQGSKTHQESYTRTMGGADVMLFPLSSSIWQHSTSYISWLRANIEEFDLVVIHSLFLSHTYHSARLAQKKKVPYIIRPHGSLNPSDLQARRKVKLAYLKLIDGPSLQRAEYIFCTSQAEAVNANSLGYINTRVIPLGVEPQYFAIDRTVVDRTKFLYIGRIAEKKGLEFLIAALANLAARGRNFSCDIAGSGDPSLEKSINRLIDDHGLSRQVRMLGFADTDTKIELLSHAGYFVLPSKDENFGIAVAEAMAASVPVAITAGVSHSDEVKLNGGGILIDRDPLRLADSLESLLDLSTEEYLIQSSRARTIAFRKYSWDAAASALTNWGDHE